jgi:hypothetical protein
LIIKSVDYCGFTGKAAWNREWCFHLPQYAAIQAKLNNQAADAVWRQDVAVQGRHISGRKDELPATDPGAVVIDRWRRIKNLARVGTDTLWAPAREGGPLPPASA